MSGELGCPDYQVSVQARCGGSVLCVLDGVVAITWTRVLDDVSRADVTIAGDLTSTGCCQCLSTVRTWGHDLVIHRGDTEVWRGPIVRIEMSADIIRLEARDTLAWFARRLIHTDLTFTDTDLTDIAVRLIRDGLTFDGDVRDDGCVLGHLNLTDTEILSTRDYVAESQFVLDALVSLADAGLDFTALGPSLIFGSDLSFGIIGSLTDEDFLEPLTIIEDGSQACTRVVAVGADGARGEAEQQSDFYGTLECLIEQPEEQSDLALTFAARDVLAGSNPTPFRVDVTQGSSLRPTAGVEINELVPGALINVFSDSTCRSVSSTLRLIELVVSVTQDAVERVQPVMAPVGAYSTASL